MKIRLAFLVLGALLTTPALWAQSSGAGAASAPSPSKVGVINMQAAISGTAEGKQAVAELQSQFAPRYTELQDMQKQINDLQSRLQAGQTTLSDDEKARLARQGDQLSRTYQRKQQELQDDSNDAQQDIVNSIGRKVVELLDTYSRQNGYAVIIDTSSQQSPVMFSANQIDVTQEVIALYDKNYPLKAAAQKPAAAKPAAPPK
ncbi:MAG: OmpH family outer membrane protein [Candidatus Acidiferrales bacterium]